jgi:hypothetical protein
MGQNAAGSLASSHAEMSLAARESGGRKYTCGEEIAVAEGAG